LATLDLVFPGASAMQLIQGLAAAGEVIRGSRFSMEHLQAAWQWARGSEAVPHDDWRTKAVRVWREAEAAAFAACSPQAPPVEARLVFGTMGG
jgi:hypothetical protein